MPINIFYQASKLVTYQFHWKEIYYKPVKTQLLQYNQGHQIKPWMYPFCHR